MITREHPMLVAISLEHQRDHDDGPAEPREGCNGCKLIEFAWQQYEAAQAAREVATALETYGQHKYACATLGTAKSPMNAFEIVNPGPCDCGLEAALARFWAQVER